MISIVFINPAQSQFQPTQLKHHEMFCYSYTNAKYKSPVLNQCLWPLHIQNLQFNLPKQNRIQNYRTCLVLPSHLTNPFPTACACNFFKALLSLILCYTYYRRQWYSRCKSRFIKIKNKKYLHYEVKSLSSTKLCHRENYNSIQQKIQPTSIKSVSFTTRFTVLQQVNNSIRACPNIKHKGTGRNILATDHSIIPE